MTLLYASTFTDALSKLNHNEQKQAKLTAFDLQIDPAGKGKSWHRIERSRDPNFWSVRVTGDIRLIVHKLGRNLMLAYVGHHDDAYAWAERKRVEVHPRTGAAQFVETPIVEDRPRVLYSLALPEDSGPPLENVSHRTADEDSSLGSGAQPVKRDVRPYRALSDDQLLDVGVPADWLQPVRETREHELVDLLDRLPAEAAEALLDVATGGNIEDHIAPVVQGADPFAHPDAERRFRAVDNLEELKAALDQPFEKWAVFLHPAQRDLVTRDWSGPARVAGTAGTGKTIVALHRAVHLAHRDPAARVLLTTFSAPLADALLHKLHVLTEAEPELRGRISVQALDDAARDLFVEDAGPVELATRKDVELAVAEAIAAGLGGGLSPQFLIEEWIEVVDGWRVASEKEYTTIPRIGRKTRLGANQRHVVWQAFERVQQELDAKALSTWPMIYERLGKEVAKLPYTHIVVDEAQDLSVAQLKFLAAFATARPNALFFAGDLGQRIFSQPFSWLRLGVDVRGRSPSLKVCYRTSHQIRAAADRLLPDVIADMDGIEEGRRGTVSVFEGPDPEVRLAECADAESVLVTERLRQWLNEGFLAEEIGILVRSDTQVGRGRNSTRRVGDGAGDIRVTIMHGAKGLEFRAVVVMACDDDVIPDPGRLAAVGDAADLEATYNTERHLLYVACTRARDRLLVTGVAPGSEFLEDFLSPN